MLNPVDRRGRPSGPVRLLRIEIWLAVLIPARMGLPVLGAAGWPALVFGVLLVVLWACGVLTGDPGLRACRPVRLVLALFWVGVLASYATMHLHEVPGIEARNADRLLLLLLATTGVALMAAEGLRTIDDVFALLRSQVAAVGVMTIVAFLQFRLAFDLTQYYTRLPLLHQSGSLQGIFARNGFGRPAGTASHPIEFGVVLALTIGPAIHLLAHDRARSMARRAAWFGIVALGVPMSISRSALLGALIVIASLIAVMPLRRRAIAAGVLAAVGVAVFLTTPGLLGTLRGSITAGQSDSSIATRTSDYAVVARYVRPHVWLGRGPGTFLPSYRILDNQYLMTLIEQGVLGVVGLLVLYGAASWLGRGARLLARDQSEHELGQCLAASGLVMVVIAATFDALSFPLYTIACGLSLGLAGALRGVLRDRADLLTNAGVAVRLGR